MGAWRAAIESGQAEDSNGELPCFSEKSLARPDGHTVPASLEVAEALAQEAS